MSDSKDLTIVTENNAVDIITEVQKAYFDIPFENSAFQTENFVIAAQITPERAYRAIGLRMLVKLNEVKEFVKKERLRNLEIERLQEKLKSDKLDYFRRKKIEINLEALTEPDLFRRKLLNDTLVELNILYKHFKALPRYTREQFEASEKKYFSENLSRQSLGLVGPKEALLNMSEDFDAIKKYESEFAMLENKYDLETLLELSDKTLSNISR